MLGIRFFALFAVFGVLASDALTARAFAQLGTTSSVPLPTARPGTKDTKSTGKVDAKSVVKPNNKADVKTSYRSVTPPPPTTGIKKSAVRASKLATDKSGAHKFTPPIGGSLATGSTPVSAPLGNVALRPDIPQMPVLPMAVAPTASTAPMDITRGQTGDRSGRQEPRRRRDQCRRHDLRSARAQARGMGDPAQRRRHRDFSRYLEFMAANPSWPSISLLRRRAEGVAWEESVDPKTVMAFFAPSRRTPSKAISRWRER